MFDPVQCLAPVVSKQDLLSSVYFQSCGCVFLLRKRNTSERWKRWKRSGRKVMATPLWRVVLAQAPAVQLEMCVREMFSQPIRTASEL